MSLGKEISALYPVPRPEVEDGNVGRSARSDCPAQAEQPARADAHQLHKSFERQNIFQHETRVEHRESGLQPYDTECAARKPLGLLGLGMGRMVGGNDLYGTVLYSADKCGSVFGAPDGVSPSTTIR